MLKGIEMSSNNGIRRTFFLMLLAKASYCYSWCHLFWGLRCLSFFSNTNKFAWFSYRPSSFIRNLLGRVWNYFSNTDSGDSSNYGVDYYWWCNRSYRGNFHQASSLASYLLQYGFGMAYCSTISIAKSDAGRHSLISFLCTPAWFRLGFGRMEDRFNKMGYCRSLYSW